ncbi:peptidoglycan DD-metalloendopeptidase family protein [Yeosuana marina]|uniref:peptidoglycan DD-metalloendopeptidase family protein n=1 Tax=Yeosuana marina TaxID=1565536 RepID=UPI00141EB2F4|nr:peptidoglycan DD-metalloendopeptidase family protein [Yeosuana marina]
MNSFETFLAGISSNGFFVIDKSIPLSKYVPIDLSANNKLLQTVDVSLLLSLETFINEQLSRQNTLVGFGGYNETRAIYQRSTHFTKSENQNNRNIHLGIDLWTSAGTSVLAPLNGTVHSFKNNTNYGDYGPTIILKHQINDVIFYTLYGHLSLESIASLEVGKMFRQGEVIGTLGDATVNGDYPPHLHFQIIKDIQDYKGDYPGVCSKTDLEFYLENCPDPNLLLKL